MGKTWADVKDSYRATTTTARLCMRADLAAQIEALEERMAAEFKIDLGNNRAAVAPQIAEEIRELHAQASESMVEFVFVGMGRKKFSAFAADYPPTDEQKRLARENNFTVEINPDAYFPALMHRCCASPEGMTLEDWTDIYNNWTNGQVTQLRMAAMAANNGVSEIPKASAAFALVDGTQTKSG